MTQDVVSGVTGLGDPAALPGALTGALRDHGTIGPGATVTAARPEPTGTGQMADSFRVTLELEPAGSGPASVVAKLPAGDTAGEVGRASGVYAREHRFYTELVPRLPGLSVPALLGTLPVGDEAGLLLEDLRGARQGDQIEGATAAQLDLTAAQLAPLQVPFWNDPDLGGQRWLQRRTGAPIPDRQERYQRAMHRLRDDLRGMLTPAQVEVMERYGAACDAWSQSVQEPFTLAHHDLRLDNLMFGQGRVWLLDWQTLGWGSPAWDLAYLMGTSAEPELRRRVERDHVARHAEALAARGVTDWPRERAWLEYRRLAFATFLVTVPAAGELPGNARGRRMFQAMWHRATTMVLDLDALELLPC